ncbi:hypothetical protein HPP92_010469 [Vanilla planifolia]|uniref:Pentatricopeptide repeat-containing protein n=1 Tax=Vanilla planifolia TaxID=51239 RepID=A0A835R6J0_VANPL|nr:hypothetical protein HPP92_010469 [Vanilla planifolia]
MTYASLPAAALSSATELAAVLSVLRQFSAKSGSLTFLKQLHACAIVLGLHRHPLVVHKLISAYSLVRLPAFSRLAFFDSLSADVFQWNSLLTAFSHNVCFHHVVQTFFRMRVLSREKPDGHTLALVSKASGMLRCLRTGRAVHCLVEVLGLELDAVLGNTLMLMYFRCDNPEDARKMFDEIPIKSAASWNALISEHVNSCDGETWKLVRKMQANGEKLDGFTVSTLLPLCTGGGSTGIIRGRQIHGYIVRHLLSLSSELHIGSCLINMYCKGENLVIGRRVFDTLRSRNVFSWTAMISGYVENAVLEEAMRLFSSMPYVGGIMPNEVTLLTILPAVGSLGRMDDGKQIHGFALRHLLADKSSLKNALMDMYSKCGSLVYARCIFDDESLQKDAISWTSMVSAYGIHGKGEEALLLFNKMCSLEIKLDDIVSLGILLACSRAGLVKEGMEIYGLLVGYLGIIPSAEMCSCMVDMLARAGQLDQALGFIDSMPLEPTPSIWGALFRSAVTHSNHKIEHIARKFLIDSEPNNPSNYVTLSNFHASCGRWDDVAKVRKRMKEKGLRKTPGLSWIGINGKFHSFYSADKSHVCSGMIYEALDGLSHEMRDTPSFEHIACGMTML